MMNNWLTRSGKHLFLISFSVVLISSCSGVIPVPTLVISPEPVFTLTALQIPVIQTTSTKSVPENPGRVYDIALSPNEKLIAVYTSNGIYIYDSLTLTKSSIRIFTAEALPQNEDYGTPALTFAPDGNYLVFSMENRLFAWDLMTAQENESSYIATSDVLGWEIVKINYSPKGDRVMMVTSGTDEKCDGVGTNMALYDLEFNLLFDRYMCGNNLEGYYRFITNNKVYVFLNRRSAFFPLDFYEVDLQTGNVSDHAEYDLYSGNAENFIYDVSPDGQLFAVGTYKDYKLTTDLVDAVTGETLQTVTGGMDLSLDSATWLRKSTSDMVVNEKCNLINKFQTDSYYNPIVSNGVKVVYAISEWYVDLKWQTSIKSLQLWNLSTCKIEKEIRFSQ